MAKKKERVVYLDILRAVACLAVVMVHVSGIFCQQSPDSLNFWLGHVLDSVSQFAVPLFIMISGALMLDEGYSFTREKWLGHIKKLVIFFFAWSAIYCLQFRIIDKILAGETPDPMKIITTFLEGYYHLWFIPVMIGLYLILPLLRLWVKEENREQVRYFLILAFVFGSLIPQILQILNMISPNFSVVGNAVNNMKVQYPVGYAAYFVLGWYLHNTKIKPGLWWYAAGIGGLLVTVFGTYYLTVRAGSFQSLYSNFKVNIWLYAAFIFVVVKHWFGGKTKVCPAVDFICRHSLGVYAIHVMAFSKSSDWLRIPNAAVAIPVEFFIAVGVSLLLSVILKKIPVLKKIV